MSGRVPGRRYLVPVGPLGLSGEPDDTHVAVLSWNERIEEWLTGQGVCGRTTSQGELAATTEVTCTDCLGYRALYEEMLAQRGENTHWPKDGMSEHVRLMEVCGLLSQWAPELRKSYPVLFRKLDVLLQLSQPPT